MKPIIFMDQGIYVCCIESDRMNINCAYGRGLTPASAFHHWQYLKEQLNLFEQRIIERHTQ